MKLFIIILLQLAMAAKAEASPFDMITSVRALGMGNAYTAIVDDANSLFYNPAGLSRVSGVYWTILDPRGGVSNVDTLADLGNLQSSSGLSGTLSKLYGEPVFASGGAKSAIIAPYFGAMYYANVNTSMQLNNPVYPEFDINYASDMGIGVGFAFPIVPTIMYMGVGIKRISRTGGVATISGDILGNLDSSALQDEFDNKGVGYSLDLGVNLSIPSVAITPTFSLVWKNVGKTSFVASTNTGPDPDPEDMIAAVAMELDAAVFTFTGSLEIRGFNDPGDQLAKRIYLGTEFSMPMLDLRAGFSQGYYSLGAGVSLGLIQLDFATYGVELGDYPGQKEDRRYLLSMTFEIGVSGFGLFGDGDGGDGKGALRRQRKLKQRR